MRQFKSLGLISCTKEKQNHSCKASEMYSASDLFKKAYRFAKKNYDFVAILSAKYGLLFPEDEIEPYDITLKTMGISEQREWANRVFDQMKLRLDINSIRTIYFHSGINYREYLIPKLQSMGIECVVPLEGLTYGKQLLWYDERDTEDSK